jgi:putative PIN family toxin of toxin-antitoxin system
MKIIIDTNVLVSGIFWEGIPGKIINAWLDEKLTLVATTNIIDEYVRVIEHLAQKFKGIDTESVVNLIMLKTQIHHDITLSTPLCRDPDDDKFIACALSTRVNHIISGDKDLLECTGLPKSLEIIRPSLFYDKYLT